MGVDSVIVVDEPSQFVLPVCRWRETSFLMPQIHDRFNDSFCLPIRPGCLDLRKPLLDSVLPTQGHERVMLRISPILLPVVAAVPFYRVRTFFQDLFEKHPEGSPRTAPGRNHRWQQTDTLFSRTPSLPQAGAGASCHHAASGPDNLCYPAWPVSLNGPQWPPRSLIDVWCRISDSKIVCSYSGVWRNHAFFPVDTLVYRGAGDMIDLGKTTDLLALFMILPVNRLTLNRCQPCPFVNDSGTSSSLNIPSQKIPKM